MRLTVSNDKMKMECKRNGVLWVAGGSFVLHGFSLHFKGPGKVIKCQFLKTFGNLCKPSPSGIHQKITSFSVYLVCPLNGDLKR